MGKRDRAATLAVLGLALLTAGCGGKGSGKPQAPQVTPQEILFPDITGGKLYGSGCNFVPTGGGMAAYALALDKHAYIKLDGKIVTLDPDQTSARTPKDGWSRYTGGGYTLTLARDAGAQDKEAGVVDMFNGTLTLANAAGQAVYQAKGNFQCKPM